MMRVLLFFALSVVALVGTSEAQAVELKGKSLVLNYFARLTDVKDGSVAYEGENTSRYYFSDNGAIFWYDGAAEGVVIEPGATSGTHVYGNVIHTLEVKQSANRISFRHLSDSKYGHDTIDTYDVRLDSEGRCSLRSIKNNNTPKTTGGLKHNFSNFRCEIREGNAGRFD